MSVRPAIRLLPPELQNQIAAGEVVERPASVIKELIENSLDAGASRIRVEIRDGGQSSIRITDNGSGIPAEQLELALTRHATSKLTSLDDLLTMRSFGFRGEALPSIASVSRFRIASATTDGEGAAVESLHGRITTAMPVAMQRGTDVQVQELFANVPARLKFLKQTATETRKCSDQVLRIALANLHVEFELIQGDRTVFHFKAGETLEDRLAAVWPGSILEKLIPLGSDDHIHGCIGAPDTAQARPDRILLYVNKRPIQDRILLSAVREAYRGRILGKEYPQAILFLSVSPDEIDVNVHPAKTEVRFSDESHAFRLVRSAVISALDRNLQGFPSPPPAAFKPVTYHEQQLPVAQQTTSPVVHEQIRDFDIQHPEKFSTVKVVESLFEPPTPRVQKAESTPDQMASSELARPAAEIKYLGQIADTYLVLETQDGMTLVDQHAAHERVLFNALRTGNSKGDRRPLLMPLELALHPSQTVLLQELWNELAKLGFSLELQSSRNVLIKATPPLLTPSGAREYLEELLTGQTKSMEDLWAMMACKGAIKAGDKLAPEEAMTLLEAWRQLPDHHYCPHGRPVQVSWSGKDLEKLFKRRA